MGDVLVEYGDFMISVILIAVVVWGLSFVLKGLYSEETSWSKVYNYKYTTVRLVHAENTVTHKEDLSLPVVGKDEDGGIPLGWDNHAGDDAPENGDDTHMYE